MIGFDAIKSGHRFDIRKCGFVPSEWMGWPPKRKRNEPNQPKQIIIYAAPHSYFTVNNCRRDADSAILAHSVSRSVMYTHSQTEPSETMAQMPRRIYYFGKNMECIIISMDPTKQNKTKTTNE